MDGETALNLVIFLPAAAGLALLLLPGRLHGLIRGAALTATIVTFALSIGLLRNFDPAADGPTPFQFVTSIEWIPSLGIGYRVGLDGISLFLVLLTTLISPIAILGSWTGIKERVREFHIALLFLETGMIGVFAATDLALFYVFWEVMLIPMILLIGIWGSKDRIYAAVKFFVYTMVGSLLMFLAILYLYAHLASEGVESFSLTTIYAGLLDHPLSFPEQVTLFSAFALSFAIKVPLFPLHTWLPDAHTEAPTAGSVVLAGVLLKMGTYGFIRFAIPFFPDAAVAAVPWISWLAIIGIIFGAMMCLVQEDMKRLIAYSSVSHLGLVMVGLFAYGSSGFNSKAVVGSIYQMLSHGVSTGALFLLVGLIYERTHSRRISDYGGFAKIVPRFAAIFFVTLLASIGLPALSGFVGEFLILTGTFETNRLYAVLAATGIVLGALYMLNLYQRVMLGKADEKRPAVADVNFREMVYMTPLIVLMVLMGIRSPWFTRLIEPSVERWLETFRVAAAG